MAVKTGVKVVVDKTKNIIKAVDALANERVMVGIPSERAGRRDGEITNAALGYIHTNGAPEVNIPARPFLIPGVRKVHQQIVEILKLAGFEAFSGNVGKVQARLRAVGMIAMNSVRATLNEGVPPPLAESTLAARRRAGFKGEKPLIRTGQLRNAITYVIRHVGDMIVNRMKKF